MISYAILTHNEGEYIWKLLRLLVKYKRSGDEIVVVDDYSTDSVTLDVLNEYRSLIRLEYRTFDGDATQKNYLNSLCRGEFILQLDADEVVTSEFIKKLPEILEKNPTVDLYYLPRINTIRGDRLTPYWIQKWGWRVEEKFGRKVINHPDYQGRLYRNRPEIRWEGLLHSQMVGTHRKAYLPADVYEFNIYHSKDMDRQISQNELYDRIEANGRTQYKV